MLIPLHQINTFNFINAHFFNGKMNEQQTENVNLIVEHAGDHIDKRQLAYMLATAYHETAHTMRPVEEYGHGSHHTYGDSAGPYGHAYYGRGFVQLTWLHNYTYVGKLIGIDIVKSPDMALIPDVAAKILVHGMVHGWFTGQHLGAFFTGTRSDWIDARSVVNGHDRAALIAGYGLHFYHALTLPA